MITGMPHSGYKPGKLYRIKDYPWQTFTIWTAYGVGNPPYRHKLFDVKVEDGVIFLYIRFLPNNDNGNGLHLVIFRDIIGSIDARMELEELESSNESHL